MNTALVERSNSVENIYRNNVVAPTRPQGSPVQCSPTFQRGSITTFYTPCNSRYMNSLMQSAVKVRVHDPYARTVLDDSISSCGSLNISEESVGSLSPVCKTPIGPRSSGGVSSPTTANKSSMTRVYINGRPVPAFATTGELAVSFPKAAFV